MNSIFDVKIINIKSKISVKNPLLASSIIFIIIYFKYFKFIIIFRDLIIYSLIVNERG